MSQAGIISVVSGGGVTSLRTDDANIVTPAAGIIDIDGVVVANATNAQPLFTDGATANTVRIELQVATAVTASPPDSNDAGIASFDDTQFTVDANGFVQLLGTGGFTWNVVEALSDDLVNANGYIPINPALQTFTLPPTAAIGDTFQIVGYGTGLYTIAQNANQQIHFGNQSTTVGVLGSVTSTHRRDCLEIVCVATDLEFSVIDSIGTFIVV